MKVYFDNSATTPVDPFVLDAMLPYYTEIFGNPSSIHSHGRQARSVVEKCRKTIADLLNTSPSEIFFTSGGTEADNTAICSSLSTFGIQTAITSKLEHHAVLHTLESLEKNEQIQLHHVHIDEYGELDYEHLLHLLESYPKSFVSLMHANNEIGNLNNIQQIGQMCKEFDTIFHSDTVQAMGKYKHDLNELKTDFIVGAAHKFHGPKGCGFLYINHETKIAPLIRGGAQERNMRGGTENVAGIVGLTKALELSYQNMDSNRTHISGLKSYMIDQLEQIEGVSFNGLSGDMEKSLYSVVNVSTPPSGENDMLLFNLDIKGISTSGGSACASGSDIGSHVLTAIGTDPDKGAIRFSFSKFNNKEEVDFAVKALREILAI